MRAFLAFLAAMLAVLATAIPAQVGPYRVNLTTDPATIPVGKANLVIRVSDAQGQPATGLEVRAIASMPGMNMGEREQPGRESEPGTYVVPAVFSMAGAYEVTVTIGEAKGVVPLRTGQTTSGGAGPSPWLIALGVAGAGLLVWTLVRVRQTGQRVAWRELLSLKVVGSLVLLALATAVSVWAVNNLRRPGAMDPIEAQIMDMNTPAPEGVLPVRLATVSRETLAPTVTYAGQAVGFVEQDIVPRVAGVIVWMPGYVGDRVKAGEVLARLDTSQLDPELAMKSAAAQTAREGVQVAQLEAEAAQGQVTQAEAEVRVAEGELAETHAMLDAARTQRESAAAELAAAQAEADAMRAEAVSAQAEVDYMTAERARADELLAKGAISRDEHQRAVADAKQAQAMLDRERNNARRAEQMVESAAAMQRRVEAEIRAAERKVEQMAGEVRARRAMVETARKELAAKRAMIRREQAMVREASAGVQGAATQRGYATLRAERDGVIVQRLVSPGQLATPGQAVLRVAQLRPIRLQANVPQADLGRVRVGTSVRVIPEGGEPIRAQVTSVSPNVDPSSRMGVVEAVVPNDDKRFVPGKFLSMELTLGRPESQIVVPEAAVVGNGEDTFVWLAEPATNGEFTVRRQPVQLGARAGGKVAVVDGPGAGSKVVVNPPTTLSATTRVADASADEQVAKAEATIVVTERGYEPSAVTVPAGEPIRLTFLRKADPSCGDTLTFKGLGIDKTLPHNEPVVVELPPQKPGTVRFACGMDMYQGRVIVK